MVTLARTHPARDRTVPVYFASDMHLRLDRPDRARRLARWVRGLESDDALFLVGDVCDFWFASRQRHATPTACEGLKALAEFRARGGALTVLPGNHDQWLGPFYRRVLGARFVEGPQIVEAYGVRLSLNHGHRVGGRPSWKAGLESRAFLAAFERLPGPVARRLDRVLDRSNDQGRAADEARHLAVFRRHLDAERPPADIAVFGHVHTPNDETVGGLRMVVLGGWQHQASYLKVDESGAALVVEPATEAAPA